MRLYELASTIRSKNAGVDHITFDIIFDNVTTYRRVLASGAITRESMAALYGIDPERIVAFVAYDAANAIKFTIRRLRPAASPGEPDPFGSQCYPPVRRRDPLTAMSQPFPSSPPALSAPTSPATHDLLLAVEHLTVRFGAVAAVSDVSLQVSRGEFVGVVGESGSGKSVTARAALGLLPASAEVGGKVIFRGEDLLGASERRWREIRGAAVGLVFQDALAALDPVYTIGDQLVEVARAHRRMSRRQARDLAAGLLAEVGIPAHHLRSFPHQLSGGMRQRAVIAAALIGDPVLVIADEPTTALDVTVQRQVLDLLAEVCTRRQVAVVLITHDLAVIAETCDRVAVMYGGIVVEEAPTDQLFDQPRHPYTRALLSSLLRLGHPSPVMPIPGIPIQVRGRLTGCPFAPRCPHAGSDCRDGVPPERGRSLGDDLLCRPASRRRRYRDRGGPPLHREAATGGCPGLRRASGRTRPVEGDHVCRRQPARCRFLWVRR